MAELFKYNDSYIPKDLRHDAEEALKCGVVMLDIYLKSLDEAELSELYQKLSVGDTLGDKKFIKEYIENIYSQNEYKKRR